MKRCARNDAEYERDGNGQEQSSSDRDANDRLGQRGLVGRWALRTDEGQAQVIRRR
jgi:hypothetical protein